MVNAIISQKSNAEGDSIEKNHFSFEGNDFSVGYDVGIDGFLLAKLKQNLILLKLIEKIA